MNPRQLWDYYRTKAFADEPRHNKCMNRMPWVTLLDHIFKIIPNYFNNLPLKFQEFKLF